jgi:membrane-bound metal-dependent hydrolase YbcI (DUF457 family)
MLGIPGATVISVAFCPEGVVVGLRLEGIASKIRLINHRGYGHHTAAALISMIYLCCGGITIQLPTQR